MASRSLQSNPSLMPSFCHFSSVRRSSVLKTLRGVLGSVASKNVSIVSWSEMRKQIIEGVVDFNGQVLPLF